MSDIKPIQTIYNGYKFRSRTEARWAVFFDQMGIKYEYEKQGYDVDGTWYLPDFWIPFTTPHPEHKGDGVWVEIKGDATEKTLDDPIYKKFSRLVQEEYFVIFGSLSDYMMAYVRKNQEYPKEAVVGWIEQLKLPMRNQLIVHNPHHKNAFPFVDVTDGNLKDALLCAQQARFEHGETPTI
jgi:hypothetical protein